MKYVHKFVSTPVGILKLVASDKGLAAILWENDKPTRVRLGDSEFEEHNPILTSVEVQLLEYFSGERQVFALPLDFTGTEFQKSVWQALLTIPYGETRSYGQIARQLGNEKAVRAVGAANGKNPISIIAPCHRVIGSSGELTGFAGGLAVKALLLDLEKSKSDPVVQLSLNPKHLSGSWKLFCLTLGISFMSLTSSCQASESDSITSGVTVTTSSKLLTKESSPLAWKSIDSSTKGDIIKVDRSRKFQTVLGFGGAFTDASCYTFNEMSAEARHKLFRELFAQEGLGLNVCRTCIGSSDYSTQVYSYDEGEADSDLKRFSVDFDRKYILPMLREARQTNPDLFLFSTPWSPPGWMKSGKSMLGGTMHRQYLPAYANYFVKFLQAYSAEGIDIPAVTIQNEVDTDQDGGMPACTFPQEIEADFAALHLGPALEKAGLKTQIWLIDHNYNLWGRAICELESADVRKYTSGIAWHGYLGEPDRMTRVHDAYPNTNMYWTEGGPDITDKAYRTDWTKWSRTFTGIFRNWCRSVTAWNLALDENGKPNIGPFPCGGIVTINSKTKEVTRSGQYYALAQFSKFVKRGAVRIDSQGESADMVHVAFVNPDGQRVLVLTNSGASKLVRVQSDNKETNLNLEADSVTTVTWNVREK